MKMTQSQKRLAEHKHIQLQEWVDILDPALVRQHTLEKKEKKEQEKLSKTRRYMAKNEAELRDELIKLKGQERWIFSCINHKGIKYLDEAPEYEWIKGRGFDKDTYGFVKQTERSKIKKDLWKNWREQEECLWQMNKLMKN